MSLPTTASRAMTPPLVTIISPVYDQERFVARCVESALAQSYPHWEQVFVDDGSSDRTLAILATYRDPRIRVLTLPHRGLAALADSYNAALAATRGSLVAILEGDDLWPPDKLDRQVPLFDDPRTVLSWGRALLVDERDGPAGALTSWRDRRPVAHLSTRETFAQLTRKNLLVPSVTVMTRRSALEAIGGFQQSGSGLFVDLATWLWITAVHDGRVTFANEVLGIYRVHPHQTSQRRGVQMALEHWPVVQGVVSALRPDALSRSGWDSRIQRRALSRGILARGQAALSSGERRAALAAFREAFGLGASARDRMFALLGMMAALSRTSLVSDAVSVRERFRS